MITSFGDKTTEDIYHGVNSKEARRIPSRIWKVAARKLDMINIAHAFQDLLVPPGNRLEALKGSLKGFHSIRINDQYRVVFKWHNNNAENVRILDYHD
ncbi:MAG: plasmid maintenance system killer protein [Elusimicrobia bacterium RIFCSPLOWO2_01_FULL_54_10]|nr:MAG: plasmid maintenance system killer protein [Elusimicrobia bacterium RIFCSPLOWO2_01_FULL_54_10]